MEIDTISQFELLSTDDEPDVGPSGSPDQPPAITTPPDNETTDIDDTRLERMQRQAELRALGKTYGHIPGVPVFTTWEKRVDCMNSAVHRSIFAGICGNKDEGVFSIVVSGAYVDDEDGGDTIIYTGSGGRKRWSDSVPQKRLRLGPQIYDQSWDDPPNQALITSHLNGNAIRVIRSWKCVSRYAPVTGYRYDGLYQIVAHWTGRGANGLAICRCRLDRLPDQPPIPIRPVTISTRKRGRKRRSDLISSHYASASSLTTNTGNTASTSSLRYVPNEPDSDVEPPRQRRRIASEEPASSQQPTISDPPALLTVEDTDTKVPLQSLGDRQAVPPCDPNSLPSYKWDPNTKELVKVPPPVQEPVVSETASDGYESDVEDDRRVASDGEDVDMHTKNRMSTEFFSDICDTPEREHEQPDGSPTPSEAGPSEHHAEAA